MKKCVQKGPVTPMADDWWDAILTMIPARLVSSLELQPHIKELFDEVKAEYEASIRKAMGWFFVFITLYFIDSPV